jgi:Phage integrase family
VEDRESVGGTSHDPFEGLVLPKHQARAPFFFTVDEVRLILAGSEIPYKTLYWMAAETGMRPGELAGLRLEDLNLEGLSVRVVQSVWAGKVQAPKNANAVRELAISPELAGYLRIYLSAWRPNPLKLLFASQNGTPLSSGNVWKRHLGPLLDGLGNQAPWLECVPPHQCILHGQVEYAHDGSTGEAWACSRVSRNPCSLHAFGGRGQPESGRSNGSGLGNGELTFKFWTQVWTQTRLP